MTIGNDGSLSASLYTPLAQAVIEIQQRQKDRKLCRLVADFLGNDIPEHFQNQGPIFYLPRHLATPTFETFYVAELTHPYAFPLVVGEDKGGLFVGKNVLKRCLGKLPLTVGVTQGGAPIVENFTIVDFNANQGGRLSEVHTFWNQNLCDFHHSWARMALPDGVSLVDATAWIDRNHRDDLYEQYRKTFALFVTHGIMFEWFTPEEFTLLNDVVLPAFRSVTAQFGLRPLVVEPIGLAQHDEKNWNAYPQFASQYVLQQLRTVKEQRRNQLPCAGLTRSGFSDKG